MVEETLTERYLRFYEEFMADGRLKYREMIHTMPVKRLRSIVIDFYDLLEYDFNLANGLAENPEEHLDAMVKALKIFLGQMNSSYVEATKKFYVRIRGLTDDYKVGLREISSQHVGKLVKIEGVVLRVSPKFMIVLETTLICPKCGRRYRVRADESGRIERRGECDCGYKGLFKIDHKEDFLVDCQKITIQEKPEELPPGEVPYSTEVMVEGDLVDSVKPGDRVALTGIVKIKPAGQNLYQPAVNAINIERTVLDEDVELTERDIENIRRAAEDPDIVEKIISSIAPSIYGLKRIKEGIALQLFGGVPKRFPDGLRVRGDINILLIGEPGTAKTQLLKYAAQLSPRGIYTSGKGSTAAGLTAAVIRDKGGDFYLEAGALVLADGGLAAIDEIDKMRDSDRVAMHEAMESQTISVYKANIRAILNARTSILAAANPRFGRYDPGKSLADNVNLSPTLLSRFDLIFRVADEMAVEEKGNLSFHILKLHQTHGRYIAERAAFSPEFLRKYIAYAKRNVMPRLSDEALNVLYEYYNRIRSGSEETVPITLRQLEALIRLSEARARMRLSDVVTREDAEAVVDLFDYMLRHAMVVEGEIDVYSSYGYSAAPSKAEKVKQLFSLIKNLMSEVGGPVDVSLLIKEANAKLGMDPETVRAVLEELVKRGAIYKPPGDKVAIVDW